MYRDPQSIDKRPSNDLKFYMNNQFYYTKLSIATAFPHTNGLLFICRELQVVYDKCMLTLIHGCSKTSSIVSLFCGFGASILSNKSLAFEEIIFHSGASS